MILELVKMKPFGTGTRLKFQGRDEQRATKSKSEATLEIVTSESYEELKNGFGEEGAFRMRIQVVPEVMNTDGTPAIVQGTMVEHGVSPLLVEAEKIIEQLHEKLAARDEEIHRLRNELQLAREPRAEATEVEAKTDVFESDSPPPPREEDSPEDFAAVKA